MKKKYIVTLHKRCEYIIMNKICAVEQYGCAWDCKQMIIVKCQITESAAWAIFLVHSGCIKEHFIVYLRRSSAPLCTVSGPQQTSKNLELYKRSLTTHRLPIVIILTSIHELSYTSSYFKILSNGILFLYIIFLIIPKKIHIWNCFNIVS